MTAALRAGDATLTVDPARGARWTSWTVGGLELLSGACNAPDIPPEFASGCFVMAPFAGRLDRGRVEIGGRLYELPPKMGPHAIHGTVAGAAWQIVDAGEDQLRAEIALAAPWPARGRVEQVLRLTADAVESELTVHADDPMPATMGWHPWLRRRLQRGRDAEWVLDGGRQYVRGDDGLPTGELAERRPGPWDDAFHGFTAPPAIRWPGALTLTVESSRSDFVLYDQRPEALCLEPQSGPPNAPWLGAAAQLDAGGRASLRCLWRWALE